MTVMADIRLPFGEFLWEAMQEYKRTLNGAVMSARMGQEAIQKSFDDWMAYRAEKKRRAASFSPPGPEEVTAYSQEIGWPLDGVAWCLGYEQKGWEISKGKPMRSWRAAVQNWKRNQWKTRITPLTNEERQIPEPLGALRFMEINYPDWIGLPPYKSQGWSGLSQGDKETVIQMMQRK